MGVVIATGWSPRGQLEYGNRFEAGAHLWPKGVDLVAYVEDLPEGGWVASPGAPMIRRSLWDCPGQREFIARHAADLAANGRQFRPGMNWKQRDRAAGYSFRYDAVKFSRQCFIPEAAAADLPDGTILVWLDGDVVTHSPVPTGWIEGLLGDADGAYLGREPKHSEIGFWCVRLGPATREFLAQLAELFRADLIFGLKEWHSAYAWDHLRRANAQLLPIVWRNLTPGGHDHVWHQSPLARYTDHLKGPRKGLARSPEARR